MLLVLDSNIWLEELGLRSGLGAVTRYFIKRHAATLVVPEVVKLEVERHVRRNLLEWIRNVGDSHRQLLAVFGKLKEVSLPTDHDVDTKIESLFADLGVEIEIVPFSMNSARSSFLKTIDKVPPSDKTQEFKDGVVWADCLALLSKDDVHLVTRDKAFYCNRDYAKGLAANLNAEVPEGGHTLTLHASLANLVAELRVDSAVDIEALARAVRDACNESINRLLDRNGFQLRELIRSHVRRFVTEDPDRLYLEFSIEFEAADIREKNRTDALVVITGDTVFRQSNHVFAEIRPSDETIKYTLPDGTEEQRRNVYVRPESCVIGHRSVEHIVRHLLD